MMQHKAQLSAALQSDGSYDYTGCFTLVKPQIEAADIAVCNFETTLGGAPYSGYPQFCSPDAYAEAVRDAGFDVFLLMYWTAWVLPILEPTATRPNATHFILIS